LNYGGDYCDSKARPAVHFSARHAGAFAAWSRSTFVGGTIVFVGLVVPHLVRLTLGPTIAACFRTRPSAGQ